MTKLGNGESGVRVKPAAAAKMFLKKNYDVVIVGGGNATGYLCRELVEQKFEGSVLIISGENVAPYERPALTKAYLHPPTATTRARLPGFHTCVGSGMDRQEPEWYKQHKITLCMGTLVTNIDAEAKTVNTNKGDTIRYGKLVHSCGSSTVKLSDFYIPGDGLEGVHYLREEEDAKALVESLENLKTEANVVVIGGGFIGLEAAAAIVGWGFSTTVVSRGPIMESFFPPHLSEKMTQEYTERKVKIVQGELNEISLNEKMMMEVHLKDGQALKADLVVVGLGARPKLLPFEGANVVEGCIAVDDKMCTSVDDILAIGDGASPLIAGTCRRFQAVDWARKSGAFAAKTICGVDYKFEYLPYNYSRVFEYTEKPILWSFYGSTLGDACEMLTTSKTGGAFWTKDGCIVGALVFGCPLVEECDEAKRLVLEGAKVPSSGMLYASIADSPKTLKRAKSKAKIQKKKTAEVVKPEAMEVVKPDTMEVVKPEDPVSPCLSVIPEGSASPLTSEDEVQSPRTKGGRIESPLSATPNTKSGMKPRTKHTSFHCGLDSPRSAPRNPELPRTMDPLSPRSLGHAPEPLSPRKRERAKGERVRRIPGAPAE